MSLVRNPASEISTFYATELTTSLDLLRACDQLIAATNSLQAEMHKRDMLIAKLLLVGGLVHAILYICFPAEPISHSFVQRLIEELFSVGLLVGSGSLVAAGGLLSGFYNLEDTVSPRLEILRFKINTLPEDKRMLFFATKENHAKAVNSLQTTLGERNLLSRLVEGKAALVKIKGCL